MSQKMDAHALMDFDTAVVELVESCKESGDPPSIELSSEFMDRLSPVAMREATRQGLVKAANTLLHAQRTERGSESSNARGYTIDGRNPRTQWDYLKVILMGSDGKLKRLTDFSGDDCELLRLNAVHQKTAWGNREAWATRARQLLEQNHSARKVGDLRKEHVAELRQLAAEAWS